VKRWMVQHTEDQLMNVFCELAQLVEGGDVAQVPIAIERGEGLVVGLIAGAGHPVWMVEPSAFKAARPRWGAAGAKSDLSDAFMLADYARTDGHRLRRVEPVGKRPESSPRWCGHALRWSRRARRRQTSCGRS